MPGVRNLSAADEWARRAIWALGALGAALLALGAVVGL